MSLFPHWRPLPTTEELCSTCEATINSCKEDKRELRKKAEDEKVIFNTSSEITELYTRATFPNRLGYGTCTIMR